MTSVEHFKCDVRRYDAIDSQIAEINKSIKPLSLKIKELKENKTQLQKNICDYMETNEIGECKLSTGALLFKETKNVVPLSKDTIKKNIFEFFEKNNNDDYNNSSNEIKSEMIFSYVYENRNYLEKKVLKRI